MAKTEVQATVGRRKRFYWTPARSSQTNRGAALAAGFGIVYVLAAVTCWNFAASQNGIALLWLNNGWLAAGLLLLRARLATLLAALSLATDFCCAVFLGHSGLAQAGLIASFDLVETYFAAVLIRNFCGAGLDTTRIRRYAMLITVCAVPPTIAYGTLSAGIGHWLFGESFMRLSANWAVGDYLGMVVGVPAGLILSRPKRLQRAGTASTAESLFMAFGITMVAVAAFFLNHRMPIFLVMPLMILAGHRLSPPLVSLTLISVTAASAFLTFSGIGPFVEAGHVGSGENLGLQAFLAAMDISTMIALCTVVQSARTLNSAKLALARLTLAKDYLSRRGLELEDALASNAASEAKYRLLAENATDIILQYDLNGKIVFASPSVRQLGYEPKDVIGFQMGDFAHPDEKQRIGDARTRILAGESGEKRAELRAQRADGKWLWFETNPAIIHDETGRIIGAVTALRDVTAQRSLKEQLHQKRAEAETSAIAKSDFLANMSHEIRTALTGMLGFAGLLEGLQDLSPTARKYADRIVTSGESLLAVVNDILDFSKLDADRVELDPHPFDPQALLAETLELFSVEAVRKGLELKTEIEGRLPSAVYADGTRVRQVLSNLLSNAIKFTETGGLTVTAHYEAKGGGQLRLAVHDTGSGIPADSLQRLFLRFSQFDGSTTRHHGGTGLGLAISKRLTEMMGGEIGVESTEGKGSTFWFTIEAAPAELPSRADAAEIQGLSGTSARILVVDDVAINRELIRSLLSPFGYDLKEAQNGAEAVAAAMAEPFDLILMDMQMPGMDGLAATRLIRQTCNSNHATPILGLSGNVLPKHLAECAEAGMNLHIAKPINTTELLTRIVQWTQANEAGDRVKPVSSLPSPTSPCAAPA